MLVGIGSQNVQADNMMDYLKTLEPFRKMRHPEQIPLFTEQEYREALLGDSIFRIGDASEKGDKFALVLKRVKVPIWKFWATIIDRSHYSVFRPNVKESLILSQTDSFFVTYLYIGVPFPFFSDRHQVLDCFANKKIYEASGGKMWEHYWTMDPNASSLIKEFKKDGRGAKEILRNDGSWLLIALPDGTTLIEVYSVNNPGGGIPPSAIKLAAGGKLESAIMDFEELAKTNLNKHFSSLHKPVLTPTEAFVYPMELESFQTKF